MKPNCKLCGTDLFCDGKVSVVALKESPSDDTKVEEVYDFCEECWWQITRFIERGLEDE